MKHLIAGAIGAVAAFSASAALALTFNFGGGSDNLGSIALPEMDGITLTITAFDDYASGTAGSIGRNRNNGWGVSGNPDRNWLGANNSATEALVLSFSSAVTLNSLTMTERGNNNSAFSLLDGSDDTIGRYIVPNGGGATVFDLDALTPAGGTSFTGMSFVLLGDTQGGGVRLSSLTVAAVPLPAALTLMLAALGGLGLVSRRRRAAQAPDLVPA